MKQYIFIFLAFMPLFSFAQNVTSKCENCNEPCTISVFSENFNLKDPKAEIKFMAGGLWQDDIKRKKYTFFLPLKNHVIVIRRFGFDNLQMSKTVLSQHSQNLTVDLTNVRYCNIWYGYDSEMLATQ